MVGFRVLVLALKSGYRIRAAARNQEGFDRIAALAPIAPYAGQIEPVIVPDITVPGAYDEAVKGVEYIIHVASPLALPTITDFENEIIKPALQGTMGMLAAAHKTHGIKKIVITGSVLSVIPALQLMTGSGTGIFDGQSLSTPS
jgi:nucleoside-diphosphate-sugar epimerase